MEVSEGHWAQAVAAKIHSLALRKEHSEFRRKQPMNIQERQPSRRQRPWYSIEWNEELTGQEFSTTIQWSYRWRMRTLTALFLSIFLFMGCSAERETQGESFEVPQSSEALNNDNKDE